MYMLTTLGAVLQDLSGEQIEDDPLVQSDEASIIETYIYAVTAFIYTYLKAPVDYFKPAAELAVQRTFYGSGTDFIRLPPYVAEPAPTVTLPSNYDPATDYEIRDGYLVRLHLAESTTTFTLMDVDRWNRYLNRDPLYGNYGWLPGEAIKVTARWGYAEVPPDIELACRRLVERLWRTKDGQVQGPITDIVRPDGTAIQMAMPPFVKLVLDRWKENLSLQR
jgi:hypothetical protein